MSEAGKRYDESFARAHSRFTATLADAYQELRDACQKAWYDYQVMTGEIPVPPAPNAEQEKASDGEEGAGRDAGNAGGQADRFRDDPDHDGAAADSSTEAVHGNATPVA